MAKRKYQDLLSTSARCHATNDADKEEPLYCIVLDDTALIRAKEDHSKAGNDLAESLLYVRYHFVVIGRMMADTPYNCLRPKATRWFGWP